MTRLLAFLFRRRRRDPRLATYELVPDPYLEKMR
jgi:hypothetical protein